VVAESRALTFLKVVPIFKGACLGEPSVFINDRAGRLKRSVTLNVVHCFLDGVKALGVRLHILEGFLAPVAGHAGLKIVVCNAELPATTAIESMVCKVAVLGGLRGSGFVGDGDFDVAHINMTIQPSRNFSERFRTLNRHVNVSKTIKVLYDSDASSPREDENGSTMACWHRNYTLGDVQPVEEPRDWIKENAPKGSVILELFLYEHGGITMRCGAFSDPFDSGQIGYIVATPEQIRETFMVKRITAKIREQVEANLRSEVAYYAEYLEGNCYGFQVIEHTTCECCDHVEPEVIDSCWGFIGDSSKEAMADHIDTELHAELDKAWSAGPINPDY